MKSKLRRRDFLRSAGAAVALPFLPSLVSEAAAQDHSYDRVLFVAWAHGVDPVSWQPTIDSMSDVAPRVRAASMRDVRMGLYMGDSYAGLEDKISVLRGVGMVGAFGHTNAMLTASGRAADDIRYKPAAVRSTSVDNIIAQHIYERPAPVDVLRLNLGGNGSHSIIDHVAVNSVDANTAFSQLFDGGFPDADAPPPAPTGPSREQLALERRRNVLQRSLREYERLQRSRRLSAADSRRLDQTIAQYRSLLSNVESQIATFMDAPPAMTTAGCAPFSVSGSDDIDAKTRDHIQLITQGFACGATRVGYWGLRSSHADSDGAHQAHSGANRAGTGIYSRIMIDNNQRIAQLLRAMDAIEEGNGKPLLDNTLVVVCSDLSTSLHQHNGVDAPFMLAGGMNGKFRMGEFIDYADYEHLVRRGGDHEYYGGPVHNHLLVSIMRGAGLSSDDWGGPGFGDYTCMGAEAGGHCVDDRFVGSYASYVRDVHNSRFSPGDDLPYLRV